MARQTLKLLALYIVLMLPLWLLNLLPVVDNNLLYAGLAFLVTCLFLALKTSWICPWTAGVLASKPS